MSEYRNTLVGIKGDGNAVGDNNRIIVNKKEEHHHHHHRGGGADKDDGSWVWGLVVLAFVLIVASCYYFSRYADAIYLTLEVVGWCEAVAALAATAVFVNRDTYLTGKTAVTVICAVSVAFISSHASANYPSDIVELARGTDSFKTFWCGLNIYGRQDSMLHTLVCSVVLIPAATLLLGPALIPAFFAAIETENAPHFYETIEQLTSWRLIILGGVLLVLAGYAHSDAGWNMWAETIRTPPAWPLCPR